MDGTPVFVLHLLRISLISFTNLQFCMPFLYKRLLLTALFLILAVYRAASPSTKHIVIFEPPALEPFRRLMNAIGYVETMNNPALYNPAEQAAGIFQIRPIRLEDYNRRTGSKYTMKDLYDTKISEKIFIYYANLIGPYNPELIARNWNGSGHMTKYYWKRIKEYL